MTGQDEKRISAPKGPYRPWRYEDLSFPWDAIVSFRSGFHSIEAMGFSHVTARWTWSVLETAVSYVFWLIHLPPSNEHKWVVMPLFAASIFSHVQYFSDTSEAQSQETWVRIVQALLSGDSGDFPTARPCFWLVKVFPGCLIHLWWKQS